MQYHIKRFAKVQDRCIRLGSLLTRDRIWDRSWWKVLRECCFLNPCWTMLRILWESRCCQMWLQSVLHWSVIQSLMTTPCAKVALRQSSDSHPDDTDWPKMAVRDGVNSTDSSLRCLIGYLFGPATLCALRWANCFSTRVTNDEQLENRVIISRECSYAWDIDWNCPFSYIGPSFRFEIFPKLSIILPAETFFQHGIDIIPFCSA